MADTPPRFKPRELWSVEDVLRNRRTGERPESDEYHQARREALRAAGLEADDDPADRPLDELSMENPESRRLRPPQVRRPKE